MLKFYKWPHGDFTLTSQLFQWKKKNSKNVKNIFDLNHQESVLQSMKTAMVTLITVVHG